MGRGLPKLVAYIAWLLSNNRIRERTLGSDGLSITDLIQLVGVPEEEGLTEEIQLERDLIFRFVTGITFSNFLQADRESNSMLPLYPERVIFEMLTFLTWYAGLDNAYGRAAADLAACLSATSAEYSKVGQERERERWRTTADSILRIKELSFLASRTPALIRKYGREHIAGRFEQQLNLAFQLFGFRTTLASHGSRQVDIVCITDQSPNEVVLVEAKTSSHPYKMPVSDERAILEYAQRDLPSRLQLICIVGQNPDQRLVGRLRYMEKQVGIPVRYCKAALIVFLLEASTKVTASELVKSLVDASQIVTIDNLKSMLGKSDKKTLAWRNLLNTYLDD